MDKNKGTKIVQNLNTPWVATQHRTFTRWTNIFLQKHKTEPREIKGLVQPPDIHTGYNLILLLESLSDKPLFKSASERKAAQKASRFQYMDNTSRALNFIKEEGIPIVNIGAEDIVDSSLVLTLGLIWALILHYQIVKQSGSVIVENTTTTTENEDKSKVQAKQDLLNWVNSKVTPLGLDPVKNFGKDWNNGVALCALNEAIYPGQIDLAECKKRAKQDEGKKENGKTAVQVGTEVLKIPKLLDVEDFITAEPDELSMMTLVGVYRENEGRFRQMATDDEEEKKKESRRRS